MISRRFQVVHRLREARRSSSVGSTPSTRSDRPAPRRPRHRRVAMIRVRTDAPRQACPARTGGNPLVTLAGGMPSAGHVVQSNRNVSASARLKGHIPSKLWLCRISFAQRGFGLPETGSSPRNTGRSEFQSARGRKTQHGDDNAR